MRAFWTRRNDEDAERYHQRTVGRLRGLAMTDPSRDPAEPDQIRARIEQMMREVDLEPSSDSGPA